MHPNTNSSCMTQAEGRCKFFKWQDELLNSQAPPQQPALGLGPQTAHPPASNSQAAPSAVAGGSGVFADGGVSPLKGGCSFTLNIHDKQAFQVWTIHSQRAFYGSHFDHAVMNPCYALLCHGANSRPNRVLSYCFLDLACDSWPTSACCR